MNFSLKTPPFKLLSLSLCFPFVFVFVSQGEREREMERNRLEQRNKFSLQRSSWRWRWRWGWWGGDDACWKPRLRGSCEILCALANFSLSITFSQQARFTQILTSLLLTRITTTTICCNQRLRESLLRKNCCSLGFCPNEVGGWFLLNLEP